MIRLGNHVVMRLVASIADAQLDAVVRISVLEGVAGVDPWSWATRPVGQAFDLARAALPDLDPDWYSGRDTGMFLSIVQGARSVVGPQDAMDIAMATLARQTRAESVRGGELYDVGKGLAHEIASGGDLGRAKAALRKHGRHRALQQARKEHTVSLTRDPGEEGGGEAETVIRAPVEGDWRDAFLEVLRGPHGRAIYDAILSEMTRKLGKAPGKKAILDLMIEHPNWTGKQIGLELGQGGMYGEQESYTYVNRVMREIWKMVPDIFQRNPRLLRDVHLHEELRALGYGARVASANLARFIAFVRAIPTE